MEHSPWKYHYVGFIFCWSRFWAISLDLETLLTTCVRVKGKLRCSFCVLTGQRVSEKSWTLIESKLVNKDISLEGLVVGHTNIMSLNLHSEYSWLGALYISSMLIYMHTIVYRNPFINADAVLMTEYEYSTRRIWPQLIHCWSRGSLILLPLPRPHDDSCQTLWQPQWSQMWDRPGQTDPCPTKRGRSLTS